MGNKSAPANSRSATVSAAIAAIAGRQHGVVAISQLEEVGLTRSAVSKRVRRGGLHRLHQGVYAVGHMGLSIEGRWMAAVLACGAGAVLSHMSAAALWELLRPERGSIDVSIPSHSGRRCRAGIRIHRCASLVVPSVQREDGREGDAIVTVRRDIPVTTPARTVRDLQAMAPPHLVRRATRQAQLAGHALTPSRAPRPRTRSELEDDFLAFCASNHLPLPEVNVKVGRWEVDFLWRRQRLAVETDFYGTHRGAVAFEDDHQRDLDLRRLGYAVRRYTGAQIRNHPALVVADLGEVLGGAR